MKTKLNKSLLIDEFNQPILVDLSKWGKPCKKCRGYHDSISTSGSNVASGARKEKCSE